MRPAIFILIVAVIVLLIGIGSGFVDINQIRGAQAPEITATHNGVVAQGGQTPAFEVETGSVKVGSKQATVKVPSVAVVPPPEPGNAMSNNAE